MTADRTKVSVVLYGATGMVGSGALLECIEDPRVSSVLVIGRASCGVTHAKVRELIRPDLTRYDDLGDRLAGHQACLY